MISLLLALSLSAAAPEAAGSAPTAHDTGKAAKPVKRKKVCQKVEMTGSSVPKRICRTVSEPAKPGNEADEAASEKPAAQNTN